VAAPHWGLNGRANFEGHAWHLLVAEPLAMVAEAQGLNLGTAGTLLASARTKLFATREARTRPGRDDKILTSWNALMIKGLARAGRRLGRPDWTALAQDAVDTLRHRVWQSGRLLATWKAGQARYNAYLDDHAFLLDALLELLQARFRREDLDWATALGDALLTSFEDSNAGGFFFTRHDHEQLIHRGKPAYDNAMPSGNGVAALALGRLGHLTGMTRYLDASERTLRHFHAAMADHPAPHPSLLTALHEHLNPTTVVVLRGRQPVLSDWAQQLSALCRDDLLVLSIESDLADLPPVLAKPGKEVPTAYVCRGVKCLPEIVQIVELRAVLNG